MTYVRAADVPESVPYRFRSDSDPIVTPYSFAMADFRRLNSVATALDFHTIRQQRLAAAAAHPERAVVQIPTEQHERQYDWDVLEIGGTEDADGWALPDGSTLQAACDQATQVRSQGMDAIVPFSPLEVWFYSVNCPLRSAALERTPHERWHGDDDPGPTRLAAGDRVWFPRRGAEPSLMQGSVHERTTVVVPPHWRVALADYLQRVAEARRNVVMLGDALRAIHTAMAEQDAVLARAERVVELLVRHQGVANQNAQFLRTEGRVDMTAAPFLGPRLRFMRRFLAERRGTYRATPEAEPTWTPAPAMTQLAQQFEARARNLGALLSQRRAQVLCDQLFREATFLGGGPLARLLQDTYTELGDSFHALFTSGAAAGDAALAAEARRFEGLVVPQGPDAPEPSLSHEEESPSLFWRFTTWLSGPWERWHAIRSSTIASIPGRVATVNSRLLSLIGAYHLATSADGASRTAVARRIYRMWVNHTFPSADRLRQWSIDRGEGIFHETQVRIHGASEYATAVGHTPLLRGYGLVCSVCEFLAAAQAIHEDTAETTNAEIIRQYSTLATSAVEAGTAYLEFVHAFHPPDSAQIHRMTAGLSRFGAYLGVVVAVVQLGEQLSEDENARFMGDTAVLVLGLGSSLLTLAAALEFTNPYFAAIGVTITVVSWTVDHALGAPPLAKDLLGMVHGFKAKVIHAPGLPSIDGHRLLQIIDAEDTLGHTTTVYEYETVFGRAAPSDPASHHPVSSCLQMITEWGGSFIDASDVGRSRYFWTAVACELIPPSTGIERSVVVTWVRTPGESFVSRLFGDAPDPQFGTMSRFFPGPHLDPL